MTILFAGGEMCALDPSGAVSESTGGTRYNTTFARCAILTDGTILAPDSRWAQTTVWTEATGDFYLHFEAETGVVGVVTHTMLELLDASGTARFRIRQTNVAANIGTLQMQYLSGSWQNAGSTVNVESDIRYEYDLFVNRATGVMKLFVSGTEQASASGLALSGITGVAQAYLYSDATGRYWSQIIAADVPTIGWRLATYYPTGNSATNTAWTNGYTAVDEIDYDDADVVYTANAGDVETFTSTGPDLTNYTIIAVGVAARARRGASGPQNLQLALRASGTNYFSATQALDTGFAAKVAIWETNPNTGVAWTGVSGLEHGVKAIA